MAAEAAGGMDALATGVTIELGAHFFRGLGHVLVIGKSERKAVSARLPRHTGARTWPYGVSACACNLCAARRYQVKSEEATMPETPKVSQYAAVPVAELHARHRGRERRLILILFVAASCEVLFLAFDMPNFGQSACTPHNFAAIDVGPNGAISQAIEVFNRHVGRYPRSLDEIFAIADNDPDREKWDGPYMIDEAALRDPWNRPFSFVVPGRHNVGEYDLWSVGPNGVDESSDGDVDFGDDIRNWD